MKAVVTSVQSPQGQPHQRPWRQGYPERMQTKGRVFRVLSCHWQSQLRQQCTRPYHSPSWKNLEDSSWCCGHANLGRVTPLRDLALWPVVQRSSQWWVMKPESLMYPRVTGWDLSHSSSRMLPSIYEESDRTVLELQGPRKEAFELQPAH